MYTLSKGPSRFVTSARRGPPRQLDFEGYDSRDKSSRLSKNGDATSDQRAEMSNPKPTFQSKRPNRRPPSQSSQDPPINKNHLEMANLLSSQWQKVQDSLERGKDGESAYEVYREKEPSRSLDDFQPFDLDKYCIDRTFKNLVGEKSPS